MRSFISFICIISLVITALYSDTIYLLGGDKYEGKIYEQNDDYIMLETDTSFKKFYTSEIKRISFSNEKIVALKGLKYENKYKNTTNNTKLVIGLLLLGLGGYGFIQSNSYASDSDSKISDANDYLEDAQVYAYISGQYADMYYWFGWRSDYYDSIEYAQYSDSSASLADKAYKDARDLSSKSGLYKGVGIISCISGIIFLVDHFSENAKQSRISKSKDNSIFLISRCNYLGINYNF